MVLGHLGAVLGRLGAVLAALGPLLGCSWPLLGDLGAVLGRPWAALGRSWPLLGDRGASGGDFGSILGRLEDDFGWIGGWIWMDLGSMWFDFLYFLNRFLSSRFDAKKCATSVPNVFAKTQIPRQETLRRSEKLPPP